MRNRHASTCSESWGAALMSSVLHPRSKSTFPPQSFSSLPAGCRVSTSSWWVKEHTNLCGTQALAPTPNMPERQSDSHRTQPSHQVLLRRRFIGVCVCRSISLIILLTEKGLVHLHLSHPSSPLQQLVLSTAYSSFLERA